VDIRFKDRINQRSFTTPNLFELKSRLVLAITYNMLALYRNLVKYWEINYGKCRPNLQTKQLQPGQARTYLESPADEATPARLGTHAIMLMYAYNSRNRGKQPPPPPSQSSRETVPWGSSTFNLPYRVSSSAGPLEKRHFFFSTLKKIQSADGSYASKVGALASRFETGETDLQEAHGFLAPMYDKHLKRILHAFRQSCTQMCM
jgi:hypothetical protein